MGYDGDLGNGLRVLFQRRNQCVAYLVIGNQSLFHIGKHRVLFLGAGNDRLKGNQQVFLIHRLTTLTDSPQGGFVDQVRQIRAYRTGGSLSDLPQVYVLAEANLPGVHLQGIQTTLEIGLIHNDPPVKPAGAQQRLIQDLRPVGSRQAHNALGGLKAVDLAEQLVQGLLLLGVAAVPAVPGTAHSIDFVNEDDARSHLGRLLEQVTNPAGAHAHEHLHKIRTGNGEEGHVGFARHGLGKQGLAGTGRAYQQRALGQLRADGGVLLGIVEEIDDFL